MSGHNKWSSIKHKKGAADAKRGRLFSRLSKEITLAAREGGGDPEINPRLRAAIAAAKEANMPNDNVERAVKKGTGDLDGGPLEEITYEGYGPGGVAILANCLTDNRNRTAADVRLLFTKHEGNLGGTGAVAWMFHRKARFVVEDRDADEERLLEVLIESGADVEDVDVSDGTAEIMAAPEAFGDVMQALETANIPIAQSGQVMEAENHVPITDLAEGRRLLRLIEALEDHDDVQEVYSNFEMSEETMEALADE